MRRIIVIYDEAALLSPMAIEALMVAVWQPPPFKAVFPLVAPALLPDLRLLDERAVPATKAEKAKALRTQLAKLPGNRKSMRY